MDSIYANSFGTKESVCIRKAFKSQRICLEHQHGRRFIVLERQYGRRDVMSKRSIECFTHVASIYENLLEQKKAFA